MDAGADLDILVDELKVGARPGGAEPHDFRRPAVIVALLRRERFVLAIESAGQIGAIDAEAFLGRVDLHLGIHAQQIGYAAHVIAVPVRHDNEVELRQIDALRLRVLREGVAVVASVEQDALAAVLDQCGIAPVLLHAGRLAESVIKDGDLRLRRVGARRLRWRGRGGAPGEHHGPCCNKVIYRGLCFHFSSPLLTRLVYTAGYLPDPATAFVKDSALRVVRCPTSWSTAGRCWQVIFIRFGGHFARHWPSVRTRPGNGTPGWNGCV